MLQAGICSHSLTLVLLFAVLCFLLLLLLSIRFDFDPLDVTKIWPEDIFPLQPVGRMVLNRNPDNFFNENEQLAFCPALVVPGEAVGWGLAFQLWL